MSNRSTLGDFQVILSRVQAAADEHTSVTDPFTGASSIDVFKKAVKDGRSILPVRYHKAYVDVLDQAVRQADVALSGLSARAKARRQAIFDQLASVFSVMASPILQLKSDSIRKELKASMALTISLYRNFIDSDNLTVTAKKQFIAPELDPLCAFTEDPEAPFTLPASAELPISIVMKPAHQANFLPLWMSDGHETGGHGIIPTIDGLEADIETAVEAAIRKAYQSGAVKSALSKINIPTRSAWLFGVKTRSVSPEDFMVNLWKQWLSEVTADAMGMLNLGPMFVDGLLLILCATRGEESLGVSSTFDSRDGFSTHPCDVVRVLLNIEMLKRLPIAAKADYAKDLTARLESLFESGLPTHIAFEDSAGRTAFEIPLSEFRLILPTVAEALLTSPLNTLAKQSLSQILNWTDEDEKTVEKLVAQLLAGDDEVTDEVSGRHIASASLLAVERASLNADFVNVSDTVHETGIEMLHSIYDEQCLLCPVQTLRKNAVTSLEDLYKLVQGIKKYAKSAR